MACLMGASCSGEGKAPLVATDIAITQALPGQQMSAAYLSLGNNTGESIIISRVASDDFERVEMHESSLENGIARMRRVDALSIAPKSSLVLRRGGKHLMLMGPIADPDVVSLRFYDGDTLLLSVQAPFTARID